jgi:hypothetical protein
MSIMAPIFHIRQVGPFDPRVAEAAQVQSHWWATRSGSIVRGGRLDERSVAQQFNGSRSPVRDALRHLAATPLSLNLYGPP